MDTPETAAASSVITLSESAVKEVKRLINVQGLTEGGLRLGVKGGGCSGLSYTINFDEKVGQYDAVYDIRRRESDYRCQECHLLAGHAARFSERLDGRPIQIRQSQRQ